MCVAPPRTSMTWWRGQPRSQEIRSVQNAPIRASARTRFTHIVHAEQTRYALPINVWVRGTLRVYSKDHSQTGCRCVCTWWPKMNICSASNQQTEDVAVRPMRRATPELLRRRSGRRVSIGSRNLLPTNTLHTWKRGEQWNRLHLQCLRLRLSQCHRFSHAGRSCGRRLCMQHLICT